MSAGGWKTKLFAWALKTDKNMAKPLIRESRFRPFFLCNKQLRVALFFQNGVPVSAEVCGFLFRAERRFRQSYRTLFGAAGIPILQGYGMTEACIVSANRPDNHRVNTIGIPFESVEVKLAEDGEIWCGAGA
jgi:long-chain acyl-CoA synthetase